MPPLKIWVNEHGNEIINGVRSGHNARPCDRLCMHFEPSLCPANPPPRRTRARSPDASDCCQPLGERFRVSRSVLITSGSSMTLSEGRSVVMSSWSLPINFEAIASAEGPARRENVEHATLLIGDDPDILGVAVRSRRATMTTVADLPVDFRSGRRGPAFRDDRSAARLIGPALHVAASEAISFDPVWTCVPSKVPHRPQSGPGRSIPPFRRWPSASKLNRLGLYQVKSGEVWFAGWRKA